MTKWDWKEAHSRIAQLRKFHLNKELEKIPKGAYVQSEYDACEAWWNTHLPKGVIGEKARTRVVGILTNFCICKDLAPHITDDQWFRIRGLGPKSVRLIKDTLGSDRHEETSRLRVRLYNRAESVPEEELLEIEELCHGSGVVDKDWAWFQDRLARLVADLKDTRTERDSLDRRLDKINDISSGKAYAV